MTYEAKFIEILILLRMLVPTAGESHNFALIGTCDSALGMEEGRIPDSAITASSSYESKSVGPQNARVRQEKNGGAWCPKAQISSKVREYLEIDLAEPHLITCTETQGRFGNGQGQEYAEQFTIEYWRAPLQNWVVYKDHYGNKMLTGNTNTYLGVKQKLELPFVASKIRFVPYSEHPRTVCMRIEIYGCPWQRINLRSNCRGIFPSAYVVDVEYNDFDPSVPQVKRERFVMKYLGSIETLCYKGNSVLCQAIDKIQSMRHSHQSCILEVSDEGLKMHNSGMKLDSDNNFATLDYFYSMKNISCCGFHPDNPHLMGFITKHPLYERFACHVFENDDSTRLVTESIRRSFESFYQKYMEAVFPVEDIYIE